MKEAKSPTFEIRLQFLHGQAALFTYASAREGRGAWRNCGADRTSLPLGASGYRELESWIDDIVGGIILRQMGAALVLQLGGDRADALPKEPEAHPTD
jgi:hypothetical protein